MECSVSSESSNCLLEVSLQFLGVVSHVSLPASLSSGVVISVSVTKLFSKRVLLSFKEVFDPLKRNGYAIVSTTGWLGQLK